MLFTTEWLSTIFKDCQGAFKEPLPIKEVVTDSRKNTNKALFIPISGETFDGHDFINQAFNNGAVGTLWEKGKELPGFLPTDFPIYFVDNTLVALQQLASAYRDVVDPTVIGITGSNGKTTTKDLMAAVLKKSFRTHNTEGNLNNHIGVPLTILSMPRDTQVLVAEMGMNHFGEIEVLSNIIKPDYAIITNIGESHIEYLGSREGIATAKLEIIKGMNEDGCLILDGDELLLKQMHSRNNVITCGFDAHNDVIIKHVNLGQKRTHFTLSNGEQYAIPLMGGHHALNATFAITIAGKMGVSATDMNDALSTLEHTSMRFELLQGTNGVSVINDAYNASPTSTKAAITVVKQMDGFDQKVLVLGDILELGEQSELFHQSIANVIDNSITAVFTLGEQAERITQETKQNNPSIICRHYKSKEVLLEALGEYLRQDTLILFKASRMMQFEWFVEEIVHSK
ncbi:UDP-N-acetylmuramoyl-tripeptide--D-alanyl-D-alanine ligase [Virgibacillus siamensis]|uniref:UDP-N-acetylmuramoyl-tripeptide--D-alanyl-D- alanine ligase n=1 Tax=Virgibacillus siamensis TaxID=480071 RepID=UPI000985E4B0|nr:UDP-N-acetylmuramoyl-tripeptide--D-alanyl-D-alanine ligase [Virgibacillus siamensis]